MILKRRPGRPKLPDRIQVTVKIKLTTKNKLIRAAEKLRYPENRTEIGKIIDWLVEEHL